ncbi:RNA-directed DNA polymerase, eukaryota, reverse transcriptase zinc-binding domain protein, partial [Tanacetum coccineum]
VSENERDDDSDARERESTPTSNLNDEIVEKKPKSAENVKSRREVLPEKTPPAAEIEAFFAAAENDLHKRFKEKSNAKNLILILNCFEESSALKVNLSESRLFGVGVDLSEVEAVASSLNCSHVSIPFLYLGLPVGKNMKYCDGWLDVIRRVQDRLSMGKLRVPFIWSSIDYIDGLDVPFSSSFSKKVSNDFDTMFWKDVWCIEGTMLMDHFPRLYALESNKDCKLADRSLDPQLRWNSWDPRKVNVCVWRASLDRLSSRVNLIARGVDIPSSLYLYCEAEEESLYHSLSISDIAIGKIGNHGNEILNRVFHGVYMCVLWSIWKWRNNLVHAFSESVEFVRSFDIFPSIQRLSKA